jgi:hypothetical protein
LPPRPVAVAKTVLRPQANRPAAKPVQKPSNDIGF